MITFLPFHFFRSVPLVREIAVEDLGIFPADAPPTSSDFKFIFYSVDLRSCMSRVRDVCLVTCCWHTLTDMNEKGVNGRIPSLLENVSQTILPVKRRELNWRRQNERWASITSSFSQPGKSGSGWRGLWKGIVQMVSLQAVHIFILGFLSVIALGTA